MDDTIPSFSHTERKLLKDFRALHPEAAAVASDLLARMARDAITSKPSRPALRVVVDNVVQPSG